MIHQKKSILLCFTFISIFIFYGNKSLAASIIHPEDVASEKINSPSKDYMRADVFVQLSIKEFSAMTGQKLNGLQKIFFKASQKSVRKDLKSNPELLITDYFDPVKQKFKLDTLWFVLGIMIGPLAILFSFTSRRSKMSRKSAFLGFLVFALWFSFLFII